MIAPGPLPRVGQQRGAPRAQTEYEVGARQVGLGIVAAYHARAAAGRSDQRFHQLRPRGVEVGARLVEQQQLGVVQHGARDRDPLHHSAGERAHGFGGAREHAHCVEQLLDPREADAVQARVEAQVLARGELAVEQRLVAEQADPSAYRHDSPGRLLPSTRTPPAWGRSSVASTRSSVVLPAPFGPSTTSVWPSRSDSETPASASRSP